MAAIGPDIRRIVAYVAALLAFTTVNSAGQPEDVLATVNYVATALSNNDAPDAMKAFSKSCKDYALLSDYFAGLTSRAVLENEVEVLAEEDAESETKLTVQWTVTLSDKQKGDQDESRSVPVKLRLIREDGKWKIADLAPTDLFDPAAKRPSK